MDKRTTSLLNFISAGILVVSAQSILLVPQKQADLLRELDAFGIFILAIFYFIASYFSLAHILFPRTPKQHLISNTLSIFAMGSLSALYIRADFLIESVLLVGLTISHALALRKFERFKNYLRHLVAITNLILGLSLFLLPKLFSAPPYILIVRWNIIFGAFFLLAAIIGIYTARSAPSKSKDLLAKFTILPWILTSILFCFPISIGNFIPGIFLITAIILNDIIPWDDITLPKKQFLGSRVFPIIYISLLFIVGLFYVSLQTEFIIESGQNLALQDIVFVFILGLNIFGTYGITQLHRTVNHIIAKTESPETEPRLLNKRIVQFASQLSETIQREPVAKLQKQEDKIERLADDLQSEKNHSEQITLLADLRKQLEDYLDEPVAAQLVVSSIFRAFDNVGLAAILIHDIEKNDLVSLAAAGPLQTAIPSGYRQKLSIGLMGHAARTRKTQIANNTSQNNEYKKLEGHHVQSEVVIPLIHHGHLRGVLSINSLELNAFNSTDIATFETVGIELVNAWERSSYNERLTALIQANIALSSVTDPQAAIEEIAKIAREALQARFVFATLYNHDQKFIRTAHSGYAPNLQHSIQANIGSHPLLQDVMHAARPLRIRDTRRNKLTSTIVLDHNMMRSLLAIPILLQNDSIGTILAFGKQGGLFFNEKDESLAKLLTSQAAAAIKNSRLVQELRDSERIARQLYDLSSRVILTDNIQDAAQIIVEITYQLSNASKAGIVLFTLEGQIQTVTEIDAKGIHSNDTIPMGFIEQSFATGKRIMIASAENSTHLYLPIQTPLRKYGVIWMDIPEEKDSTDHSQTLKTLATQAAITLERMILLLDVQEKAKELKAAFGELENSYDQTLLALMTALDARDHETEGHSSRVGAVACMMGKETDLSTEQLGALRRGSLLHDIGKIGISDTILHKPDTLSDDEWEIMHTHPDIGARIVQKIPFLADAIPVIRNHHERWDGSGYPLGLSGEDIPIEARIFAVADVFDALTSIRPYRKSDTPLEALAYIQEQADILFDPEIVAIFERLLLTGKITQTSRA